VRVRVQASLPCPVEEAWGTLLVWERQADWMLDADRVEVVGGLREGVGVRLAVRTRILGLPAFAEPMEVVGWDPPRALRLRHGGSLWERASGCSFPSRAGRGSCGSRTCVWGSPSSGGGGEALRSDTALADGPRRGGAPASGDRRGSGPVRTVRGASVGPKRGSPVDRAERPDVDPATLRT